MKKARMTIEELRELQKQGKLPVTLECDDKHFINGPKKNCKNCFKVQ